MDVLTGKLAHAQTVCTRPFLLLPLKGPGDEACTVHASMKRKKLDKTYTGPLFLLLAPSAVVCLAISSTRLSADSWLFGQRSLPQLLLFSESKRTESILLAAIQHFVSDNSESYMYIH